MEAVSKRLRRLKDDSRQQESFERIKRKLEKEGILKQASLKGEVVFFNNARGYGFIKSGCDSYFIHVTAIEDKQYPGIGERYSFELGDDSRVRKAVRIDSKAT